MRGLIQKVTDQEITDKEHASRQSQKVCYSHHGGLMLSVINTQVLSTFQKGFVLNSYFRYTKQVRLHIFGNF